ncbi:MAG: hypothetical protein WAP48_06825 [Sediminibacterium sp.]
MSEMPGKQPKCSFKYCDVGPGIKDLKGATCDYYGYQWWIDPEHKDIFYARGILGQYIIVIPSKKRVIVRLAHKAAKERVHTVPTEVRYLINWGLQN